MKLSIIIVSYNTRKLLSDCLRLVYDSRIDFEYEVVVVDNGSEDGSVEMMKKKFKRVKVIENKENLGFSRANNQGMKEAKGDCLLLLNSDTRVSRDVIDKVALFLERNNEVGVVGCKLLNEDGSLQYSVGYLPRLSKLFTWSLGVANLPLVRDIIKPYHASYDGIYEKEKEVGWVTGAFFLLRKEVYERSGGFDEKVFMYVEEVEWCKRIWDLGYKIVYSPEGCVYHLKGASGAGYEKVIESEYIGLVYYFKKHKPSWEMPFLKIILYIDKHFKYLVYKLKGDKIKAIAYEKVS